MSDKSAHNGNGNSFANGPMNPFPPNGWDIKAVTHWDATEGRLPR